MTQPRAPITQEFFSTYQNRRWHPDQPLVVLHQYYAVGADTGTWQHMDFYALYVVRGGRGIHEINGHPYAVRRGDVYMTPPGATHCYRDYLQLRAEAFCFQAPLFSDDELDSLGNLPGFRHMFVRGDEASGDEASGDEASGDETTTETQHDYQLHLSPAHYSHVERLVDEVLAEMQQAADVSPLLVRGLMFQLLVYLTRVQPALDTHDTAANAEVPHNGGTSSTLADILHICEARFAESLTVPQLAALMFLSAGHFSELFAREVGMPPGAYLRQLRLERAQTLLRTTALTITEVAQQSGFGDSAQLARAFKAAFGATPSAYRGGWGREVAGS